MVLLRGEDASAYLEKTNLLPTLEAGIEAILRASDNTDPVNALVSAVAVPSRVRVRGPRGPFTTKFCVTLQ